MNDFMLFLLALMWASFIAPFVCNLIFERNDSFKYKLINSLKFGCTGLVVSSIVCIATFIPFFIYDVVTK